MLKLICATFVKRLFDMTGGHEPGLEGCYATAACLSKIAQTTTEHQTYRLRLAYGLTEASALVALLWGTEQ